MRLVFRDFVERKRSYPNGVMYRVVGVVGLVSLGKLGDNLWGFVDGIDEPNVKVCFLVDRTFDNKHEFLLFDGDRWVGFGRSVKIASWVNDAAWGGAWGKVAQPVLGGRKFEPSSLAEVLTQLDCSGMGFNIDAVKMEEPCFDDLVEGVGVYFREEGKKG